MKITTRLLCALLFLTSFSTLATAQITLDSLPVFDYSEPKDYEIGGVKVVGAEFTDANALISISGFKVGDRIRLPGGDIPRAMKALWKLRLFTDVSIVKERTIGDVVFLEIRVKERPRLSQYNYKGAKKAFHDDLNDATARFLTKGGIVTENVKTNAAKAIEQFYIEKGYLDAEVTVSEQEDPSRINSVQLTFEVDRGPRVKIADIVFEGNEAVPDKKLRKLLDNTKRKKKLFSSSKYIREDYETDKEAIINYYNTVGFRDARIVSDEITRNEDGQVVIRVNVEEGNQYYFRDIAWKGNSIYTEEVLTNVLGIEAGEVYNQELLETRLRFSQDGRDVSTLYMDNGYLFFQVDPVEVSVDNDSIDLEIRIFEGPQATIENVTITGNDRTHEHVVRRELRTRPGEKFSRSDIIRSQREIINLGYFNPETLNVNTPVNPQRGTVDIEYIVEEKPSDQLELSAGWGGFRGGGVIGTLGVSFNNFSMRNIFNKDAWRPLPQGDGQRLSLRAQTNGKFFQSYNASFTEPWLGGKKPQSLTIGGYMTVLNYEDFGQGRFTILGVNASLGTRLRWPDDNFVSTTTIGFQDLNLNDQGGSGVGGRVVFTDDDGNIIRGGDYNNFSISQTIARSSISNPLFPTEGSKVSLTVKLTPPYSLFNNKDYSELTVQERFKFVEYHKWRFDAEWYTTVVGKLVLKAQAKIGLIGSYNDELGISPFERFQLGGDGLNNQQFSFYTGTDIISMRGYEEDDLENNLQLVNGVFRATPTPVFDKFTVELRYPLSLNPNSTIYGLVFAQGGNAWRNIRDFNPFDVKRSVGAGVRVFLPMFGMLGFDWGIGFDKDFPDTANPTLGDFANFNIILGFEPE